MAKLTTNTVLRLNPVAAHSRATAIEVHTYSAKVQNDFDYTTIIVSGIGTADAQVNAVDEYFRQVGLLPNSVTLTQIK